MPPLSKARAEARSRIGVNAKRYGPDHPKTREAQRDYKFTTLSDHIEKILAQAPPLNDEQRVRLAELLRPVAQSTPPHDRKAVSDGGV